MGDQAPHRMDATLKTVGPWSEAHYAFASGFVYHRREGDCPSCRGWETFCSVGTLVRLAELACETGHASPDPLRHPPDQSGMVPPPLTHEQAAVLRAWLAHRLNNSLAPLSILLELTSQLLPTEEASRINAALEHAVARVLAMQAEVTSAVVNP